MVSQRSNYRPEIDGLRGVAILAVLANHVDSRLLPGGYVGVDVFFVISGYLIASILLRDAAQCSFSFAHFYARRVRRLLPAATVMSAIVMAVGSVLLLPRDFKDLGASLVAYAAMASNFLFWRWDDYFAGQTKTWPLLHTWSLAVEEQFYLVFPAIIVLLAKRSRLTQVAVVLLLFAVSFAISVWQSEHDARSAYYFLPGRSWELLAGAFCALIPRGITLPGKLAHALGLVSVACVVMPMVTLSERSVFPGWNAFAPVAGTAGLLMLMTDSTSVWRKLLATPWLVWVGLISYSLYLWHWPLLTLVRYPWSGMAGSCPWFVSYLGGIASLGIAWLSFQFIETPGRAIRMPDGSVLRSWAIISLATIACGLAIHRSGGVPQRLPEDVVQISQGVADWHPRRCDTIDLPVEVIRAGAMPRIGVQGGRERPDFALWGDSHADALVPAFDQAARERAMSGIVLTRGATPPLLGIRFAKPDPRGPNSQFPDRAIERIQKDRPCCVILASMWSNIIKADVMQGDRIVATQSEKCACLAKALSETLATIFDTGVTHVWVLGEVPAHPFNVPKQLALHGLFGWQYVNPIGEAEFREKTAGITQVFESVVSDRVSYLDLASVLRQVSKDGLRIGTASAYSDDNHVSATASKAIAAYLGPVFDTMAGED